MSNLILKTAESSTSSGMSTIAIIALFLLVGGLYFFSKRSKPHQ